MKLTQFYESDKTYEISVVFRIIAFYLTPLHCHSAEKKYIDTPLAGQVHPSA
jgi:hypothetical protein